MPIVFYKMEVLYALLWHKLSLLQVTPLICSHCNSQHCSPAITTNNTALESWAAVIWVMRDSQKI